VGPVISVEDQRDVTTLCGVPTGSVSKLWSIIIVLDTSLCSNGCQIRYIHAHSSFTNDNITDTRDEADDSLTGCDRPGSQ